MSQLFGLFYKVRNVFLFLILETICFGLLNENNIRWNVTLFNSSNNLAGGILTKTNNLKEYVSLKEVNENLANENQRLNQKLAYLEEIDQAKASFSDSIYAARNSYTMAKVVGNTYHYRNNYFTINKGKKDGLKPGMGVIGPNGVVGQIKACSDNFCTGYSILHSLSNISIAVKNDSIRHQKNEVLGIGKWDGKDPSQIKLTTVLKHKPVFLGDSVFTSEQNSVFPPGILVGTISKLGIEPNNTFYDLNVKLSTDFPNLIYVYAIKNNLSDERNELEKESIPKE